MTAKIRFFSAYSYPYDDFDLARFNFDFSKVAESVVLRRRNLKIKCQFLNTIT
jgi:hypothetical protein